MILIDSNPFRVLGIYVNSPLKTRLSNLNRINAYAKVGKQVAFPSDLNNLLPEVVRAETAVTRAEAELALPKDRFRHGQFWFMNCDETDKEALAKLASGDVRVAETIWRTGTKPWAYHNLAVLKLMSGSFAQACQFVSMILDAPEWQEYADKVGGEGSQVTQTDVWHMFLDSLSSEIEQGRLTASIPGSLPEWREYMCSKVNDPMIERLRRAIEASQATQKKSPKERYEAAVTLMNEAKAILPDLRRTIPDTDLRYAALADNVGLELLQCSIDYYNDQEGASGARKAKELLEYAGSVVVGRMAKERCEENLRVLNEIIAELPPEGFDAAYDEIISLSTYYSYLPESINCAVALMQKAKPYLLKIKSLVGIQNAVYLHLSTQVIAQAMNGVVAEVNSVSTKVQNDMRFSGFVSEGLRRVLRAAWNATEMMAEFDMETDFYVDRYCPERGTLKHICNQCGISTAKVVVDTPKPQPEPQTVQQESQPAPVATQKSNKGMWVLLFVLLAVLFFFVVLNLLRCS